MKIYPSINIEIEGGYRNSVVLGELNLADDWNELKDCLPLLEDWARHIESLIADGTLPAEHENRVELTLPKCEK